MNKILKFTTMIMASLAVAFSTGAIGDLVGGKEVAFAAGTTAKTGTGTGSNGTGSGSNGSGSGGSCVSDTSGQGLIQNGNNCATGTSTVNSVIIKFAQVLAGIVLGFAVLMIVYAGFKYTTSQGDPKVTEQAKMQIIAAGIGIAISMLAFVLLHIFTSVVGGS